MHASPTLAQDVKLPRSSGIGVAVAEPPSPRPSAMPAIPKSTSPWRALLGAVSRVRMPKAAAPPSPDVARTPGSGGPPSRSAARDGAAERSASLSLAERRQPTAAPGDAESSVLGSPLRSLLGGVSRMLSPRPVEVALVVLDDAAAPPHDGGEGASCMRLVRAPAVLCTAPSVVGGADLEELLAEYRESEVQHVRALERLDALRCRCLVQAVYAKRHDIVEELSSVRT